MGERPDVVPGDGCVGGHDQHRNPTHHPRWGLVPAKSSVVFGIILIAAVAGLLWWLAPWLLPFLAAALILALGISLGVQLWLGHRGRCLRIRTVRWWLGPIGSLIDPME